MIKRRGRSAEERRLSGIFGMDVFIPDEEDLLQEADDLKPVVEKLIDKLKAITDPDVDEWDRENIIDSVYEILESSKMCDRETATRYYNKAVKFIKEHEALMPPKQNEPSLMQLLEDVDTIFDEAAKFCRGSTKRPTDNPTR